MSVRLLTIEISQWARENFCNYRKNNYITFIFFIFKDKEKWQPLPLVTITEENEEALGNKLFRQALKKVGLKPPANEQVSRKCSVNTSCACLQSNSRRSKESVQSCLYLKFANTSRGFCGEFDHFNFHNAKTIFFVTLLC